MRSHKRSISIPIQMPQNEHSFLQQLESTLLSPEGADPLMMQSFEKIFNQKKVAGMKLEIERQKNQQGKQIYLKVRERVLQVEQLQRNVEKQTAILQMQTKKISEVHMMNKLLLMQKIVRLQRETQNIEVKRKKCLEQRATIDRSLNIRTGRKLLTNDRIKETNLSNTITFRSRANNDTNSTFSENKRRAQSIRQDAERRRVRLMRIEKYKQQRSKRNYLQKLYKQKQAVISGKILLDQLGTGIKQKQINQQVLAKLANQRLIKNGTDGGHIGGISSFFTTDGM